MKKDFIKFSCSEKAIPLNLSTQGISEPLGHNHSQGYQKNVEQSRSAYFDYAAATPVHPEVVQEMTPWFKEYFANPSSIHQAGQQARAAVDEARMIIAEFLHASPTEIYFTSSATESCNWALLSVCEQHLLKGKPVHIIVSSIEHSAILKTAEFLEKTYGVSVTYLPVDQEGIVDPKDLEAAITDQTVLASVMLVNNEVGTVQPLQEIAEICRKNNILLHSDACQAAAWQKIDVEELQVDLLTLNASKMYGPKGAALLYVRENTPLSEWTFGGGQEFGKRAGTENVPAIVGFGKAVELIDFENEEKVRRLKDDFIKQLLQKHPEVQLQGSQNHSSPHIVNFYIPGMNGETLVKKLDLAGFAISSGSACASGKVEPSHVILALGHDQQRALSSIRISFGIQTTPQEIDKLSNAISSILQKTSS